MPALCHKIIQMEHELKKHLHNIVREAVNRKKSFWKRISEIMIEMLIIVFAVSFAVYMEKQREHSHEEADVKEFLVGLRTDLENDIKEMNGDIWGYTTCATWLNYFVSEPDVNIDSLKKYQWVLISKTHLLANKGRYEGFKASGKMNTIQRHQLRNKILDLYEERIIGLTNATQEYMDLKNRMLQLLYKLRRNAGKKSDNLKIILKENELRNYLLGLANVADIVQRYEAAIQDVKLIIQYIEEVYPELRKNPNKV